MSILGPVSIKEVTVCSVSEHLSDFLRFSFRETCRSSSWMLRNFRRHERARTLIFEDSTLGISFFVHII